MRWILALPVAALAFLVAANAEAQERPAYYCDSLHVYYPTVARCPIPWRAVPPSAAIGPLAEPPATRSADACDNPAMRSLELYNRYIALHGANPPGRVVAVTEIENPRSNIGPQPATDFVVTCHVKLAFTGRRTAAGTAIFTRYPSGFEMTGWIPDPKPLAPPSPGTFIDPSGFGPISPQVIEASGTPCLNQTLSWSQLPSEYYNRIAGDESKILTKCGFDRSDNATLEAAMIFIGRNPNTPWAQKYCTSAVGGYVCHYRNITVQFGYR